MNDRENVVEHLYDCLAASRRDNMWIFVRRDIVVDAALLLLKEKQEPEKVLQDRQCEIAPGVYIRKGFCPGCNQEIIWYTNERFCGFCGKAVKWDDSD